MSSDLSTLVINNAGEDTASAAESSNMLCDPTTSSSFSDLAKCTTSGENKRVPQDVLYPAYTNDYSVYHGRCGGLGMVANRFIPKGSMVLTESVEFLFADVQEGDSILMVGHEMASVQSETTVPERVPLTRDMLIRTHGVPVLKEDPNDPESAGIEFYRLEVPWMLLNHSCDPNVVDSSHKEPEGEAIAARDIQKGEELTYDYTHQYYDKDLHSFACLCGASNCRNFVTGFAGLSEGDKEKLWPHVSDYIKVRHAADTGVGPKTKVEYPVFPPRTVTKKIVQDEGDDVEEEEACRLVMPGPSICASDPGCGACDIAIQQTEKDVCLVANKDFAVGEEVYSFWNFVWPDQGRKPIDIVSASDLLQGDLPEGTVTRVKPLEHGVRDSMGRIRFSGYDMFRTHSCEPNLVYNYKDEDEEDDWRCAYAVKPIQKGDVLTIDFNTVWWDRPTEGGICHCGASNCRGTAKGFSHLSKKQQEELKALSWLRETTISSDDKQPAAGQALSPHIHASVRRDIVGDSDATEFSVTSSNVSSSDSSSEEE